jgi:hypothetical protein
MWIQDSLTFSSPFGAQQTLFRLPTDTSTFPRPFLLFPRIFGTSTHDFSVKLYSDLAKNWDVDIAADLEAYLEEIGAISAQFDDDEAGENYKPPNFAEGAFHIISYLLVSKWLLSLHVEPR